MKASIITIGDEILIGQIVDTNSGFIAKSLDRIGVEIHEMISISDNKQHNPQQVRSTRLVLLSRKCL